MDHSQRGVRAVAACISFFALACNSVLGNESGSFAPGDAKDGSSNGPSDASDEDAGQGGARDDAGTDSLAPPTCRTCSDLHLACGMVSDGCGNALDCGVCPKGEICESGQCAVHPGCGNGTCDGDEACGTCPIDCICADGGRPVLVGRGIATVAQAPGAPGIQLVHGSLSAESGFTCVGPVCSRGGVSR